MQAAEENLKDARLSFQKAHELDPDNVEILRFWGELEFTTGQYAEASDLLEKALQYQAPDHGLRYLLAQAVARNADLSRVRGLKQQSSRLYGEALEHVQSALVENTITTSKQHNLKCYELMINVYQQRGQSKYALEACKKALDIESDNFTFRSMANTLAVKAPSSGTKPLTPESPGD